MSEGWIVLHRGWRDNPIFKGEFSRADAWVWMIENASWKPTRTRIKGQTVELQRGEMSFAVRFLADAWGWSKSRADRFLADLRDEGMIETRSKIGTTESHHAGQGQSIITICNYAKYQDVGAPGRDNSGTPARDNSGTTAGQQRDKEEPLNQGTIRDEEAKASPSARDPAKRSKSNSKKPDAFVQPEWADPVVWSDFRENRKQKRLPNTPTAYSGFLAEIARLTDTNWPPGRLLAYATMKGWGAIYPPDELKGSHNVSNIRSGGTSDRRTSLQRVADEALFNLG